MICEYKCNQNTFRYLKGWVKFVRAVQKCLQYTLTSNDLDEVRQLLLGFYRHYERYYIICLFNTKYIKFFNFLIL
jgi:hypothetical protein